MSVTIVAISDTHGMHRSIPIPEGDILVHAGDITGCGSMEELEDFNAFLGELPHRHKVVIAGNHDFCFEREAERSRAVLTNAVYLQDEAATVGGIRFYGSPWQPWFLDWAFNLQRGPELRAKWDLIPDDTQVLVTHGPPHGYGDEVVGGERVGCQDLLQAIERVRPRVHICGHIHEGAGVRSNGHTVFLNASSCTVRMEPVNPALVYRCEFPAGSEPIESAPRASRRTSR